MIFKLIRGLLTGGPLYLKINRARVAARNASTGDVVDVAARIGLDVADKILSIGDPVDPNATRVLMPFDHPRILVRDFTGGEKIIQYAIRRLYGNRLFRAAPVVVIHPDAELDGGLTSEDDAHVTVKYTSETVVAGMLIAGIIGAATPLMAQEVIEPRPIPEPTAEQREINRSVRPRNHCVTRYPDAAAAIRQEGWVIIEFTISADGLPIESSVLDSSPAEIFDAAALEALATCRFEPKIVEGEATEIVGAHFRVLFEL